LSQDQKRSIFSVAIAILFYFKKELVIKNIQLVAKVQVNKNAPFWWVKQTFEGKGVENIKF
jgi:hypothetical protein